MTVQKNLHLRREESVYSKEQELDLLERHHFVRVSIECSAKHDNQ